MPSFDTVLNAYHALPESVASVMLSTVDANGATSRQLCSLRNG